MVCLKDTLIPKYYLFFERILPLQIDEYAEVQNIFQK